MAGRRQHRQPTATGRGSHFDQANWYAFGRLAWDPELSARAHRRRMGAHDLLARRRAFVQPVVDMMMGSREAVVDYMTPLGLHHLMATRPPLRARRPGSTPARARLDPGLLPPRRRERHRLRPHRDRQQRGRAVRAAGRRTVRRHLKTVPDEYLLWFHHVPWDYRMRSGQTAVGRAGASLRRAAWRK